MATDVVAFDAGWSWTMFVKKDGTLWGTGANEVGQLGDGTVIQRFVPTRTLL